jgi:chemotaxis family two-component system response regulator Rcp1
MLSESSDSYSFNILLVEDNAGDARLAQEALIENHVKHILYHVKDGLQALEFLHKKGAYYSSPRPDLIFLDLNLPKINGHQVLAEIKSDESLKKIPVVILSISQSEKDIERSYELNANCYVTKPLDINEFIEVFGRIQNFWLKTVKLPV